MPSARLPSQALRPHQSCLALSCLCTLAPARQALPGSLTLKTFVPTSHTPKSWTLPLFSRLLWDQLLESAASLGLSFCLSAFFLHLGALGALWGRGAA